MGKNAERFIAAYNRIEKKLEQILAAATREQAHHRSFPDLVHRAAEISAAVRLHEQDLREFGELRNAIVHGSTQPERVIAEPHTDVVEAIELIYAKIAEPEKVLPRFAKRVVYVRDTDTLSSALDLVANHEFSQLPVFSSQQEFKGMLTETGIARWLAWNHKNGAISLLNVTVGQALRFEKPESNCRFISPQTDIYEVREIFAANYRRDRQKIKALLITESGLPELPMLGIITPWDVATLF